MTTDAVNLGMEGAATIAWPPGEDKFDDAPASGPPRPALAQQRHDQRGICAGAHEMLQALGRGEAPPPGPLQVPGRSTRDAGEAHLPRQVAVPLPAILLAARGERASPDVAER